jgi:hypothetical protein
MNFCSLEDAFPEFNNKKSKGNSELNDNVQISKKINKLEKREVIKPNNPVDIPLDEEVNMIHKDSFHKLDKQYKEMFKKTMDTFQDEIDYLKNELSNKKNNNTDLVEAFSFNIENDQFNELMLYVCTCIFFIFMFDYMFTFGMRSY